MQEKESFCCETTEIHEDLLEIVNRQMPPEEELYDLAELLKYLGIRRESASCSYCLKRKSAYVIWRKRCI